MIKIAHGRIFYRIIIVGAGGTGGILLQNLAHYLAGVSGGDHYNQVVIVDGDIVEEKNVGRQKFTVDEIGQKKAKCLATRYSDVFGLDILYYPDYIRDEEMMIRFLTKENTDFPITLPVLVMCVDNNFSRKLAHMAFYNERVKHMVYIDTGNEDGRGQTVIGFKYKGNVYQEPCGDVFPSILDSDDQIIEGGTCGQEVVGKPQLLIENIWSSTIALTYLINLLKDNIISEHFTFFNVFDVWARSHCSKKMSNITIQ